MAEPITSHTATATVAPASGPVTLYWWRIHRDSDGALLWQQSSPYWQTELKQHQIGDEPFVVNAQAWGSTLGSAGKIGPYSDVYQFVKAVPEPGLSLLLAGLVALALLGRGRK